MTRKNPKVDAYLQQAKSWQEETQKLREVLLECPLEEELKWGKPCYTFQNNNIAIIQGFKVFCALLFTKGALLKDPKGILEPPGDNTQSARRTRFTTVKDIVRMEGSLKDLIHQAIEAEKAGLKVKFKETKDFEFPREFQDRLDDNPKLKAAFEALTPGRQRGYLLHFSSAKQSKTRTSRVEKCIPKILGGKGFHDR